MEIKLSLSKAGAFFRILLEAREDCELSAIMTSPSGREEIFLPSPEKLARNVTYPPVGGRFVTQTGRGKYQIIFQPKEKGSHELKILGRSSGKPFSKAFQINFE